MYWTATFGPQPLVLPYLTGHINDSAGREKVLVSCLQLALINRDSSSRTGTRIMLPGSSGEHGWPTLLFGFLYVCGKEHAVRGHNATRETGESRWPLCEKGYYCPLGGPRPVPCPRGTFGPTAGATSVLSCLSCPPDHYCPRPALPSSLPCGSWARQPLPGQGRCVCLGQGQTFQASDGQCTCSLGYQVMSQGDYCLRSVYDICRDGRARTQHGVCLDREQWAQHCTQQACLSPEDYKGFDGSLGLCLCREPPEKAMCGQWCRRGPTQALHLKCAAGDLQLVYSTSGGQVVISEVALLDGVFKRWDSQGALQCDVNQDTPLPVYTVQTSEAGFLGLLNTVPEEMQKLFPEKSPVHHPLTGATVWEGNRSSSSVGVLNPTACLHLGDTLLFTVSRQLYPKYDIENLYNTNSDFDWGPLRRLAEDMKLSRNPPTLFSMVFTQPGVYAFKLSGHQHKHMYVRVMPAGVQCYELGPFFPTVPLHLTRMGVARRQHLLLRPDWLVTGGLLLSAVVIIGLCVTLLILFREYGWPEKVARRARYRTFQIHYPMEDFSSKGSRVTTFRKHHRNHPSNVTEASLQHDNEFWDYEHQVDLEAFSTITFYRILLDHSLSVTARLGQLRGEVKDLYQGVMGKLKGLQLRSGCPALGKTREGYERLRRQVEQEVVRRRSLAQQLRHLLDRQLGVLATELRTQQTVHKAFGARLRECVRHTGQTVDNHLLWDDHKQHVVQRVSSLASEMAEEVSRECWRQGAWVLLGEATGAELLCPDTGSVLSKEDIFAPDGSVRCCEAVRIEPFTGLVTPRAHAHMLLASGHSMPVPPSFFVHPQTGRLLPIVGNVGYDPVGSSLVFTTDLGAGDVSKWDLPLLSFVPYPICPHSTQPVTTRLRGLRHGQPLQLGGPMCDPETGLLVPILAVTIHPQTGLVYPLGGVHVCPITHLPQPIQMGSPIMDPRTGNVVLTAGVSLDSKTGAVIPVGGLLLGESAIEPLSGRQVRVEGGSVPAGKLVHHSGGFQALLDSQALAARIRLVDALRGIGENPGSREMALQGQIQAAANELETAWGKGMHCRLQLLSRLETLLDWASAIAQDGGVQGEIRFPGTSLSLPALPGMEYPDPQGSGLTVPVLGSQLDPVSGLTVPLAGTMENPDGKGLVAIRFGALTVDPVTGVLAAVVGARLDVSRQTVVPVTASYSLALEGCTDNVLVEVLQKERCLRSGFWKQEKRKEEELLGNLDAALQLCLLMASQEDSEEAHWAETGGQLRQAASGLQDTAQAEAQRKACQLSDLSLVLPAHVLLIFTAGDEKEWEQECCWHTELMAGLDRVNVCVEKLQHDHERWRAQRREQRPPVHGTDQKVRLREIWEQLNFRQTELEGALTELNCARELCQFRAETAQSMLAGTSWYKEFGLTRQTVRSNSLKAVSLMQRKALPLLEQLLQLLEGNPQPSLSSSAYRQRISGLSTKPKFGLEACSHAWTESLPVVKGISTQSLRDPVKEYKDVHVPQPSPPQTAHRKTAISDIQSEETQTESVHPSHVCVPTLSDEEWNKLLDLSPVFRLLQEVEQKLKAQARDAGLLRGDFDCSGRSFIDYQDAQWECEGKLLLFDPNDLNPRESLVYQHGLFLLQTLHTLKLTPAVSLQIAASLPSNNYKNNAFRNSFFYEEAEQTVFVRRQRLQSVGGFSLLLLHCLSHIAVGDMCSDYSPAFQRVFFEVLQTCLGELFQSRLGSSIFGREWAVPLAGIPCASPLQQSLQGPNRGLLCKDEGEGLLHKYREVSLFLYVERLLREKSSGIVEVHCKDQKGNSNLTQ
ncbi:hypothetical protein DPEC_G00300860 [Dallia pectoralis]|uniref:Uncharacterized protein n=1 Tax=Dallia pectoralis TaxID=75939 RepID=A0ACC2FGJ4_DALPE|nr:hypothetical protein DPEC_G00300860 [Dallia pectoralis]